MSSTLKDSSKFWDAGRALGGIYEYTHKSNGLRVYLLPSTIKNGVCSFNVAYDVGSKDEMRHQKGNAHFLEHALFQGTRTWDFQSSGAEINAMTQVDLTNFYATIPSDKLHAWIGNEAGRMTATHFTEEQVHKEARVVRNEYEIGKNNPMNLLYSGMMKTALNEDTTIGRKEDFCAATAESLNEFWSKNYTTDRAAIICTGDLPSFESSGTVAELGGINTTLDVIHREFGQIKPGSGNHSAVEKPSEQFGVKTLMINTLKTPANIVSLGFRTAPASTRDSVIMSLISNMTNGPTTGRVKSLIEAGLFYEASAMNNQLRDNNIWMITAGIPQVELAAQNNGINGLMALLNTFKTSVPSLDELNMAKVKLTREHDMRGLGNTDKMLKVNGYMQRTFNPFHGLEVSAIIDSITPEDVKRVANTYFADKNMTIARYFPSVSEQAVEFTPDATEVHALFSKSNVYQTAPIRAESSASAVKETKPALLHSGTEYTTSTNHLSYNKKALQVRFVDKKEDINTHLKLSIMGTGVDREHTAKEVLNLTTALMLEGVQSGDGIISKIAIGKLMDTKRISLSFGATHGSLDIALKCPREHSKVALGLLSHIVNTPVLPEATFKSLLASQVAELHGEMCSVDTQADSILNNSMYPKTHPNYSTLLEERESIIKNITYKDVVDFHNSVKSAPRMLTLMAPNSKAVAEAAAVLVPINVKSKMSFSASTPALKMPSSKETKHFVPDKTSVAFRMGIPVDLHRNNPDFLALQIACRALAGGFGTRLMDEIRDAQGLTYGISGALIGGSKQVHHSSSFVIRSSCNPTLLEKLQTNTKGIVAEFIETGMSAQELTDQKNYAIGSRKVSNDRVTNELNLVHRNMVLGKPSRWLDTFEARVNAITLEQANSVIRSHLDINKFHIVTVGTFVGQKA
jgi:zinc protease